MSLLSSILRGARGAAMGRRGSSPYRPFTQPPYRGRYPFKSASRVYPYNTNVLLPYVVSTSTKSALRRAPASQSTLSLYEDRRLWHPLGKNAFPKSITESYPSITSYSPPVVIPPPDWRRVTVPRPIPWKKMADESMHLAPATTTLNWENPWKMIICLKRKMRRELMHAMGMAGKKNFKKPKYTQFSYVRCH